ncbi:hypothetical protein [Echinicola vietnamensis]|nr:hypothetical protein [Echinicola vietnamensis]
MRLTFTWDMHLAMKRVPRQSLASSGSDQKYSLIPISIRTVFTEVLS